MAGRLHVLAQLYDPVTSPTAAVAAPPARSTIAALLAPTVTTRGPTVTTDRLAQTIADLILESIEVTFTPVDHDGTAMPTAIRVRATLHHRGRVYTDTAEVGFGRLALADDATGLLVDALDGAAGPVRDAALAEADRDTSAVSGRLTKAEALQAFAAAGLIR